MAVRVTRADPRFAGVASEVKLWRDRIDPGMGGLVTYVLIIPALMLLLLAVVLAFVLMRRGRTAPLVISLIAAIAFFAAFMRASAGPSADWTGRPASMQQLVRSRRQPI